MLLKHQPFKYHHTGCNGDGPLRTHPSYLLAPHWVVTILICRLFCLVQEKFFLLSLVATVAGPVSTGFGSGSFGSQRTALLHRVQSDYWMNMKKKHSRSLALKRLRQTTQFCLPALLSVRGLKGNRTRSPARVNSAAGRATISTSEDEKSHDRHKLV